MTVKTYRKKPNEIDAIQFTWENMQQCKDFLGNCGEYNEHREAFEIATIEGVMTCTLGNYIVKGIKGEFYPVQYDIFKLTYEEVE